ncbi:MAG: hypothetical protein R3C05_23410 [Pirellulaceae bacterium]
MLQRGTVDRDVFELLDRLVFPAMRLAVWKHYRRREVSVSRVLPLLLELAAKSGHYDEVEKFAEIVATCSGYAAALIEQEVGDSPMIVTGFLFIAGMIVLEICVRWRSSASPAARRSWRVMNPLENFGFPSSCRLSSASSFPRYFISG